MKKLLAILLSFISIFSIAAFAGCDKEGTQDGAPVGENQTDGQDKTDDRAEIATGTFYTVTEAYKKGYLTREQVMSIAYYHNEKYDFVSDYYYQSGKVSNEEIRDETYTPIPITPEKLSTDTENSIKQTYLDLYYKDKDYAELSGVRIDSYYGTFDGCVAVMITDNYSETTSALRVEEVADIGICYNNGNRILIWIYQ